MSSINFEKYNRFKSKNQSLHKKINPKHSNHPKENNRHQANNLDQGNTLDQGNILDQESNQQHENHLNQENNQNEQDQSQKENLNQSSSINLSEFNHSKIPTFQLNSINHQINSNNSNFLINSSVFNLNLKTHHQSQSQSQSQSNHSNSNSNSDLTSSPRSSSSSNQSDLISYPDSSFDDISLLGDQFDQSDLEFENHLDQFNDPFHQTNSNHSNDQINLNHLLNSRQTSNHHLVMPLLPINPSHSNKSRSSRSSSIIDNNSPIDSIYHRSNSFNSASSFKLNSDINSSYHHLNLHPDILSSINHSSIKNHQSISQVHSNIKKSKALVLGDLKSGHGLGQLNTNLAAFINRLDRATDLIPQFQISNSSTHYALIEYIENSFVRLKNLLNPNLLTHLNSSSLPSSQNDLIKLIDYWVENEGYLIALVEMPTFPAPPETIEFILTLSKLIPVLPFISSTLPTQQIVDSHAILTRQFMAKRVVHFPIPNLFQIFIFPEKEECLSRSRKCYLDWLILQSAIDAELWEEIGLVQTLQETNLQPSESSQRFHDKLKPSISNPSSPLVINHLQVNFDNSQSRFETDPIKLPSMACIFQIAMGKVQKKLENLFHRLISRLLGYKANYANLVKKNQQKTILQKNRKLNKRQLRNRNPNPKEINPIDRSLKLSNLPSDNNKWFMMGIATFTTVLTLWGYGLLCS
ncbi:hypothetical protein O181_067637 [Austropuccinia psidii MF-1]|uniref:Uncharacterized protein n=1 Tax=Austropuccinia psidii MF-1 TaxID=1389203 RepID=A0A9Q3I5H0_9BASI|nr:hypothetical protein [Austropuccinia psidii MF-1]